jgi:meso-butanediol dehydrogenase / (S,S)-butanediol dehydrogenase / diacetyl reductase
MAHCWLALVTALLYRDVAAGERSQRHSRLPKKAGKIMAMRFSGKTAIVTGAASGIGDATARLFLKEGAKGVVVADLNSPDSLIKEFKDRVLYVKTDVGVEKDVINVVDQAAAKFGQINILVNNAAKTGVGALPDIDVEFWNKVIGTNIGQVFFFTKSVIPHMRKAGGGAIVNIASIVGSVGQRGQVPYGTSKGAIINFTRCVALDHAKEKIRVNVVSPGVTMTPAFQDFADHSPTSWKRYLAVIPMGRGGAMSEIAEAIAFLASDAASYITGTELRVDGGQLANTHLPDWSDEPEAT